MKKFDEAQLEQAIILQSKNILLSIAGVGELTLGIAV